ncbi:galactosyl transferase GMA12/MNN10 family-domain-containing protein [Phycomyces nitens]|nr:galactosyl transferase GMA12/MNN10 family-domain-containing protein [Phycomyces nitens]
MAAELPLYKNNGPKKLQRPSRHIVVILMLSALLIIFLLNRHVDQLSKTQQESLWDTAPTHTSLPTKAIQKQPPVSKPSPPPLVIKPASPHSDQHSRVPRPLVDLTEDSDVNQSGHYTYLVVIGSEASQGSRRQLIRSKYFGLRDNLLPCMQYDTDVYYTFWIHGGLPLPDTALRRTYESEKMEWNDMQEIPARLEFGQANVIAWVENTLLAEKKITYDYLIIQDGYSFIQLSETKIELDSGVIGQHTHSPYSLTSDTPLNFVWGTFDPTINSQNVILGSTAAKLALAKRTEIHRLYPKLPLLTGMYELYNSIQDSLKAATDASLEPEAAAEEQERLIPAFIREDGPEGTQRFIQWENNIESVHTEDIVVREVYQDSEFAALSDWSYLKPTRVCHQHGSFSANHPPVHPMDDDQDMSEETEDEEPIPTNGPLVAVLTSSYIYDACMEPSATLAAMNKRAYALEHNYAFVARSAEFAQQSATGHVRRKAVWGKIDVLEKALPKYDWVFWLDMDAVIMNRKRSLEDLLEEVGAAYDGGMAAFDKQIDMVVSRPSKDPMINAGVLLMRNTPWAMQFLRDLQDMSGWYQKGPSYEQGAMWELLQRPGNRERILLLDRDDHTFNTFPSLYIPGDFIVHFAPDKCPNDAVMKGLGAANLILEGHPVTVKDIE